jgi:malate permease and related proteins
MPFFVPFIFKLVPLYLNISLGFFAGKWLDANRDTITRIMFYMINPLIVLNGVMHTTINKSVLTLPVLTFLISSCMCVGFYRISRKIWMGPLKNLAAFSAGTGNTGYFGLPLAIILFSDQTEGIYIMSLMGVSLYEMSLGYYVTHKGRYSVKECLERIVKLPTLYAFTLGLTINLMQFDIPFVFEDFMRHIKGAYTVLGMMIIGLGIAGLTNLKLDMKFIGITFLAKFLVWPLVVFSLVALDANFFHLYTKEVYEALILISIVPLGVNTVVMATLIDCEPEKAAAAVLLSTFFAIVYIPMIIQFL